MGSQDMGDRYECTLSKELLEKAIRELNEPEDNSVRLASIDALRTKFEEEAKDLELIRSDDAFLLRFLRGRKFNLQRAFGTLVNYHTRRRDWKELFDLVDDPKQVETLLREGALLPLESGRAKDGTYVIISRPGFGFSEKKDTLRFIAIVLISIDKLLEQEEFQIYGVTAIEDYENCGMSTSMQMMSYGKKFLFVLQEAMPVRLKSVNLVNEAFVFDVVYAIVSKFIKEKVQNRLQVHGSTYKTLHKKIDKSLLPSFLGGTGPNLDPDSWTRKILSTNGDGEDTAL